MAESFQAAGNPAGRTVPYSRAPLPSPSSTRTTHPSLGSIMTWIPRDIPESPVPTGPGNREFDRPCPPKGRQARLQPMDRPP